MNPRGNRNAIVFFLVSFAVILFKWFVAVKDNLFFRLGADPIRHEYLIREVMLLGDIAKAMNLQGAYRLYLPGFHSLISAISMVSGMNPAQIMEFMSLISFSSFFLFTYLSTRIFLGSDFKARLFSLLVAACITVPSPNPQEMASYLLLPFIFYLSLISLSGRRTSKILFFLGVAALSVTHYSAVFFMASITIAVLFSSISTLDAKSRLQVLVLWAISAFSWFVGFFLFAFFTVKDLAKAFAFYFRLPDTIPSWLIRLIAINSRALLLLMILFAIIFFICLRHYYNRTKKKNPDFVEVIRLPILSFISLSVCILFLLFLMGFTLSILQFLMVFATHPIVPYSFRMGIVDSILQGIFFRKTLLLASSLPANIDGVLMILLGVISILLLVRNRNLFNSPLNLFIFSFVFPIILSLSLSPFFGFLLTESNFSTRLISCSLPAASILAAVAVLKFVELCRTRFRQTLFCAILFTLLVFSSISPLFFAGYASDLATNQGYKWFAENTVVDVYNAEMSFDTKGYYHIPRYPLLYEVEVPIIMKTRVSLEEKGGIFTPTLQISSFGMRKDAVLSHPKWKPRGEDTVSSKIYMNKEISFYYAEGENEE